MFLRLSLLFFALVSSAAVHFGPQVEMGRVSSAEVDENSGLAVSRVHHNVLYGLNDHGGTNRIFAMDPTTGDVKATLTISGAHNNDWEDLCVGHCGHGQTGWCIYIADIGDEGANIVYKVKEPTAIRDASLHVMDKLSFTWGEVDAESLMIDPMGELYIISKVHGGDALFAKLPASGWGSSSPVPVPSHETARLGLHTDHNDPQGADLSPDGRALLVKTEEGMLLYQFSANMNYASEMAGATPKEVSTYVRRKSGESVAWAVNGEGCYTLPEGLHQVFNYYTVTGLNDITDIVG